MEPAYERIADLSSPASKGVNLLNSGMSQVGAMNCSSRIKIDTTNQQYSQANGVQDLGGRLAPERQYLAHEMKTLGYETPAARLAAIVASITPWSTPQSWAAWTTGARAASEKVADLQRR